jgi:Protein of unknown function (DUF2510).
VRWCPVPENENTDVQRGWYDDGAGRQRYWDGTDWTEHYADTYAAEVDRPARGLRSLWGGWTSRDRWVAVGSAAGTVIGLVGLVVPLVIVDRGASGDTIAVHSQLGDDAGLVAGDDSRLEPVAAGLSASAGGLTAAGEQELTWAVPVDAPWEELFALHVCEIDSSGDNLTARGEADTAAADAWIERYGVPTTPHHLWATITNTAGAGAITVSAIRPQGTLTPAPDRVWVTKAQCGGLGDCSDLINARIALGTDPVAVFGDPPFYECGSDFSDVVAYPGDPVVFNVAPGQARPLYLTWTQTEDFVGRFVASLAAGGQTSTLDLSPGNADITSIAVNVAATLELGGGTWTSFICDPDGNVPVAERVYGNHIEGCTLAQWLAMIGKD